MGQWGKVFKEDYKEDDNEIKIEIGENLRSVMNDFISNCRGSDYYNAHGEAGSAFKAAFGFNIENIVKIGGNNDITRR